MCQLESGTILNIGWNENVDTGELLNNHFTYSDDNGKTWSKPLPTSTHGQASSLCAIGGEKFISLHAVRRDSKKPGIYANVIDFSNKTWDVTDQAIIWEPATPIVKNEKFADVFAYLKFGQPSAIKLSNGNLLATHWFMEQGQYKVTTILIEL
jgi:sialidase-1